MNIYSKWKVFQRRGRQWVVSLHILLPSEIPSADGQRNRIISMGRPPSSSQLITTENRIEKIILEIEPADIFDGVRNLTPPVTIYSFSSSTVG